MSLLVQIGADINELKAKMQEGEGLVHRFSEQVHEMAAGIAGAFAIERVAEFAKECSELAAKAAGIKTAFNEISGATALLADMRETVHGTVGNLDLMKDAVRANNLHIPLQDLGVILEFVHQRALATGGSFQEMAQTIITGIGKGGRGMIGAMSELQISTERYKEAVKETGSVTAAVMKLAQEEIEKSKGKADEFNQSLEQTGATWDNTKEKLGEYINKSTFLNELLKNFNIQLQVWGNENFSFWQKLVGGPEEYKKMVEAANEEQLKLIRNAKAVVAYADILHPQLPVAEIKNISFYEEKIKDLKEEKNKLVGRELTENERLTAEYEKQLKALNNQYQTQVDAAALAQDKRDSARLRTSALAPGVDAYAPFAGLGTPHLTGGINTSTAGPDHRETADEQMKRMMASAKDLNKELTEMGKLGDMAAHSLVGAFKSVIDGTQSAGAALGQFVENFGLEMLTMALSGIIATAMNPSSNAGNYYAALALAGAGIAAVGAMFASAGVHNSSGGVSASGPSFTSGNAVNYAGARMSLDINFQPIMINGTQLKAIAINQGRTDSKVTGG